MRRMQKGQILESQITFPIFRFEMVEQKQKDDFNQSCQELHVPEDPEDQNHVL